jgi:hypothetical protein
MPRPSVWPETPAFGPGSGGSVLAALTCGVRVFQLRNSLVGMLHAFRPGGRFAVPLARRVNRIGRLGGTSGFRARFRPPGGLTRRHRPDDLLQQIRRAIADAGQLRPKRIAIQPSFRFAVDRSDHVSELFGESHELLFDNNVFARFGRLRAG